MTDRKTEHLIRLFDTVPLVARKYNVFTPAFADTRLTLFPLFLLPPQVRPEQPCHAHSAPFRPGRPTTPRRL